MKVKFKYSEEPSIHYKVIDSQPIFIYDDVLEKETNCIELQGLGYVAEELLEEVKSNEGINAIDVLDEVIKIKNIEQ